MSSEHDTVLGVPISPGRAVGPIFWMTGCTAASTSRPPRYPKPLDTWSEASRVRAAADLVFSQLSDEQTFPVGSHGRTHLPKIHGFLDSTFFDRIEQLVRERELPADRAVRDSFERLLTLPSDCAGPHSQYDLALTELRNRLITELRDAPPANDPPFETPRVVFAHELTLAEIDRLNGSNVLAIATEANGLTSNESVALRSLGVPVLLAPTGLRAFAGACAEIDADAGIIRLVESREVTTSRRQPSTASNGTGATADGIRIPLLATITEAGDVLAARESHAEGLGLLTTEFCYLATDGEPTSEEQVEYYRPLLDMFHGKPCIVRAFTASSDAPLLHTLPSPESNPALGMRGIRFLQANPSLFRAQLQALAKSSSADLVVTAPMMTTVDDGAWFAGQVLDERISRVGATVETPAAALMIDKLLDIVDLILVDVDGLTQYTLATDADNSAVGAWHDPWHPAVLRLLKQIGEAAARAKKPLSFTGNALTDPLFASLGVGYGATSLSVSPLALNSIGAQLSRYEHRDCIAAARDAIAARSALEARTIARSHLTRST